MENKDSKATVKQAMEYPGVALNESDKDGYSERLEKEATKELNNNPRNKGL